MLNYNATTEFEIQYIFTFLVELTKFTKKFNLVFFRIWQSWLLDSPIVSYLAILIVWQLIQWNRLQHLRLLNIRTVITLVYEKGFVILLNNFPTFFTSVCWSSNDDIIYKASQRTQFQVERDWMRSWIKTDQTTNTFCYHRFNQDKSWLEYKKVKGIAFFC